MDLKDKIKRFKRNLSDVARALETSPVNLYQKIGRNSLTYAELLKIAEFCECSISDLLADEEKKPTAICPHCGKEIKFSIEIEKP